MPRKVFTVLSLTIPANTNMDAFKYGTFIKRNFVFLRCCKCLNVLVLVLSLLEAALCAGGNEAKIQKVWPLKIRYNPGEEAVFEVTVVNEGTASAQALLHVAVIGNLDDRVELPVQTILMGAGENRTVRVSWKIPDTAHFGYEVAASFENLPTGHSKPVREYFTVGRNGWEVGRYKTFFNTAQMGWTDANAKAKADQMAQEWRKQYIVIAEHYSGQPGIYTDMAPEPGAKEWFVFQNHYIESAENLRQIIRAGHDQGLQFSVYTAAWGVGPSLLGVLRDNPDFAAYRQDGSLTIGTYDSQEMRFLAKASIEELKAEWKRGQNPGQGINGCLLLKDAPVFDIGVREILKAVEMFGFDGVRWDGAPLTSCIIEGAEQHRGKYYDYQGRLFSPPDMDLNNKQMNLYFRQKLRERHPELLIGYNIGVNEVQRKAEGVEFPETYKAIAPDSYILWENLRAVEEANHPQGTWPSYVRGIQDENFKVWRPRGAFLHGGWMGGGPVFNRHMTAVMYASGLHWDTWADCVEMFQFGLRFGAFLWDGRIQLLPDAQSLIRVGSPGAWWRDFPQYLEKDGKKFLIVHLLTHPVQEKIFFLEKKEPDPLKPFDLRIPLVFQKSTLKNVQFLMPGTNGIFQVKLDPKREDPWACVVTPCDIPNWAMVIGVYQ